MLQARKPQIETSAAFSFQVLFKNKTKNKSNKK